MKRIVIAAGLGAVLIVGIVLAMQPVQKATMVHTSIQSNVDRVVSVHILVGNATAGGFGDTLPVTAREADLISGNSWIEGFFEIAQAGEGCAVRADTNNDGTADITVASIVAGGAGGVATAAGAFTTVDQLVVTSNYTQPAARGIDTASSFCTFNFDIDNKGT